MKIVQLISPNINKRERLYINIAYTQYPIIKEVGKLLNFKITRNDEADWDLIWLDSVLPPEKMLRMKSHQKGKYRVYNLSFSKSLSRNVCSKSKKSSWKKLDENDEILSKRLQILSKNMVTSLRNGRVQNYVQ